MTTAPPAFLHQTDLFRPYNDPDDHWDLLCAFALAKGRHASLRGILIDYPPGPPVLMHSSDPDLGAVAQLSLVTHICPPVAIGRADRFSDRGDFSSEEMPCGVRFVLEHLRESRDPMYITIVGSARDIAEAIAREPDLFRDRCAGIYLNAGSGSPDPAAVKALEWNVALDPAAYAAIFRAPCPLYWMPCLEDEDRMPDPESRQYATHYRFRQGDILTHLPMRLRNYFGSMFARETSSFWRKALDSDFEELLRVQSQEYRLMYSTACFFDIAGLSVTPEGELLPRTDDRSDRVYRFEPIEVVCTPEGITRWEPTTGSTDRYLFHVLDTKAYPQAMTRAMRRLVSEILDYRS